MRFSSLLLFHICAGTIGLLSGTVAMFFRKGSRGHGVAGNVFVISMLSMATSATYLAFMRSQPNNFLGGILTFYLVATAWMTARRRDGKPGIFDWVALLVALAVGTSVVTLGLEKTYNPERFSDGAPAGMDFFLGSVVLLAAAGDIRMLVRGGIAGVQRIARHLWRMCFALFIATGSFFLGQATKVFPALVGKTNLLLIPAILPLILLIFWLFRVRFTNAFKGKSTPRGGDAYALRSSPRVISD